MGHEYKKSHKYSEILDNLYSWWRGSFYCGYFHRQQICSSIWHWYTSFIRNIKKNLINPPGRIQFFIEYHEHSKCTVEIIKNGYGRKSNSLGICQYASGKIIVNEPRESKIADIGSARIHLHDGYPQLWKLKDEAESECKQKIDEIKNLVIEIDSIISSELERKIEATDTQLIRKPALFTSQREYPVSCYYDDIYSEIIDEIKTRLDGKLEAHLELDFKFEPTGSAAAGDLTMCTLSFGKNGKMLCKVREVEYDEIRSRIEKLVVNLHLKDRVSKVLKFKNDLETNEKRTEFFKRIDDLWNNIYLESQSLNRKAKCPLCPFKEY